MGFFNLTGQPISKLFDALAAGKDCKDDYSEELSSAIALLLMTPLVVLLFAFASQDRNLSARSNSERGGAPAVTIVLPPR